MQLKLPFSAGLALSWRRRDPPALWHPPPHIREPARDDTALQKRIERLTPGQRLCLLLVAQHMSSKEIAMRLGISPHTVDQRLRCALRTLNVHHRRDAALLLLRSEARPRVLPLPFATRLAPNNDLTITGRLVWIALIAIASALGIGLFLATLESVAEMLLRLD